MSQSQSECSSIWQKRIDACTESGLSAAAWCRNHQIVYSQFIYWRCRLQKNNTLALTRDSFVELDHPSSLDSGLSIQYEGIKLSLAKNFDEQTLLRCLKTMRRVAC